MNIEDTHYLCAETPWNELTTAEKKKLCGICPAFAFCFRLNQSQEDHMSYANFSDVYAGQTPEERIVERRGKKKKATKTHCKNGHPWSDDNVRFQKTKDAVPYRVCRTCRNRIQSKSIKKRGL